MSMDTGGIFNSSANDECDEVREATYEYKLTGWFDFNEKQTFKLSLLPIESHWEVEKLPSRRNEYLVTRKLEFFPPEATKNWSITINVSDLIIGDNRIPGKFRRKVRGPRKEFLNLTATDEKPFVEFEYTVQESEDEELLAGSFLDYFCEIRLTVVDYHNLSGYLNKGVDFTKPFPASNVILEMDDEKRIYFMLETLALQSPIFYKFLMEKDSLVREDERYVIKMEDTDIIGIIIILKLMTYKDHKSIDDDNVERVAFMAKKWKFEMILAICEDFYIDSSKNDTDENYLNENHWKLSYLSQQYDMSQLQHLIWETQEETAEKLREHENRIAEERSSTPIPEPHLTHENRYLEHITAEKFEFPEMNTTFSRKAHLKFKPGVQVAHFSQEWILDWKMRWKYNHNGSLFFTIGPSFPEDSREFNALNWSINFVFTLKFNGKERKCPIMCTPKRKSCTIMIERSLSNIENTNYKYTLKIETKSIKGLRFFVNDTQLRSFETRSPSSDVILRCEKTKLFANIRVLSLHSDFFKEMIENVEVETMDPKEQLPVVTVETADAKTVTRILNYVYNVNRKPIKPQHSIDIIPFADFYKFNRLLNRCEEILVDFEHYPLGIRTLDYAIDHNLHTLKDEYLHQFRSFYDMQRIKEESGFHDMSNKAKLALYETIMQLPIF